MYLETYIIETIEGQRRAVGLKAALYVLSILMKTGVRLRNFAFDCGILKKKKAKIPVVSIGNIVAGGTGKTPLIAMLGSLFASRGKIAILSRGYKAKAKQKRSRSKPIDPLYASPKQCGDEPYLLSQMLPNAAVYVGKNRATIAKRDCKHMDVIFLDDGMQYRWLHRDLEIVMVHAASLYGKKRFLPFGYLRDFPERLRHADYIFAHHVFHSDKYTEIKRELCRYSTAPVIGTKMKPQRAVISNGKILTTLHGKKVGVFCALGNPQSFLQTVRSFGGNVVETWQLPDHARFQEKKLEQFASLCKNKKCDLLLCSQKDWVKLLSWDFSFFSLPIGYLQADMEVIAGHHAYQQLLRQIENFLPGGERA